MRRADVDRGSAVELVLNQVCNLQVIESRALGRRVRRNPSTAFPNSTALTSPSRATEIPVDAQAYISVRDDELRETACSRASPRQPATVEPNRHCEIS